MEKGVRRMVKNNKKEKEERGNKFLELHEVELTVDIEKEETKKSKALKIQRKSSTEI